MNRSIARLRALCLMDVGVLAKVDYGRGAMDASFSASVRRVGGSLLALVAFAPVIVAACSKTDAAPDAAPAAATTAAANATGNATGAATPAATPTAPLDTATPGAPGTPHPHPAPGHSGDAGGSNVPPPVMPTTIPLPSGITIPTAIPTTIVIPSAIHIPTMPTASTPH